MDLVVRMNALEPSFIVVVLAKEVQKTTSTLPVPLQNAHLSGRYFPTLGWGFHVVLAQPVPEQGWHTILCPLTSPV
jgi:hypothetical protein